MFHKVVWQHSLCKVQWDVYYPCNCKFTDESSSAKIWTSVKIWRNYGNESVAPIFGPPCIQTSAVGGAYGILPCGVVTGIRTQRTDSGVAIIILAYLFTVMSSHQPLSHHPCYSSITPVQLQRLQTWFISFINLYTAIKQGSHKPQTPPPCAAT